MLNKKWKAQKLDKCEIVSFQFYDFLDVPLSHARRTYCQDEFKQNTKFSGGFRLLQLCGWTIPFINKSTSHLRPSFP